MQHCMGHVWQLYALCAANAMFPETRLRGVSPQDLKENKDFSSDIMKTLVPYFGHYVSCVIRLSHLNHLSVLCPSVCLSITNSQLSVGESVSQAVTLPVSGNFS